MWPRQQARASLQAHETYASAGPSSRDCYRNAEPACDTSRQCPPQMISHTKTAVNDIERGRAGFRVALPKLGTRTVTALPESSLLMESPQRVPIRHLGPRPLCFLRRLPPRLRNGYRPLCLFSFSLGLVHLLVGQGLWQAEDRPCLCRHDKRGHVCYRVGQLKFLSHLVL